MRDPWARKACLAVQNAQRVVAIELVCAAQALDLRGDRYGAGTEAGRRVVRGCVPRLDEDRRIAEDLRAAEALVKGETLVRGGMSRAAGARACSHRACPRATRETAAGRSSWRGDSSTGNAFCTWLRNARAISVRVPSRR